MKELIKIFIIMSCLTIIGCTSRITHPYGQEYVIGQSNIKENVDVEMFTSISEDFEIGADKEGYAVFKEPDQAFDRLMELYTDGIKHIQSTYNLKPLSRTNYKKYGQYGWQITKGTQQQIEQAAFISKFFDIYENSFRK